ncbi:Sodium/hydrogen exchanger 3 [Clonorchis sinensis]|uniref:Sodium/hydrogen exchanger n=1 Tax=Clonorchis sinensis TaxID=79923 RepID=A0A8T1N0W2_CLOSI|nr:Sodium/hydrogen exchanger 3 [Clonorchis sinensis]
MGMPTNLMHFFVLYSYLQFTVAAADSSANQTQNPWAHAANVLAKWHFQEFETHITILIFLICVILLRMIYEHLALFTTWIPESFVHLSAGVVFGSVLRLSTTQQGRRKWELTPSLFFNYLLPPIVLDSAYCMYNRAITEYIGAIMTFAVVGSILNSILTATLMWTLYVCGAYGPFNIKFDFKSFLVFSTIISAVDPVAVLATLQEIRVDLGLYYTVFGESLFNDAVIVALYGTVTSFSHLEQVTATHVMYAVLSLFTVSIGGLVIGALFGLVTCLVTRFQNNFGSVLVLTISYFSYIMGDCLGWSGLMALICCGLIQTAYAFHNLSQVSVVVVRRVTKITAEISESVIFLFMGLELVSRPFEWHTGFCLWALIACLLSRAVTVLVLANLLNFFSDQYDRISPTEQITLIYGGLRGAVCFCLAVLVKQHYFRTDGEYKRPLFITATMFIIFFTIIVMGMTIRPLIMWLRIPLRREEKLSLFHQLNEHILDESLCAVETILDRKGRNRVRDWFYDIDDRYIRKWLQRDPETHNQKIVKLYEQIALKLHYAMIQPAKSELHLDKIPRGIKMHYTPVDGPAKLAESILTGSHAEGQQMSTIIYSPARTRQVDSDFSVICSEDEFPAYMTKMVRPTVNWMRNFARWRLCGRRTKVELTRPSMTESFSGTSTGVTNVENIRRYLRRSRVESFLSTSSVQHPFMDNLVDLLVSKTLIASKTDDQGNIINSTTFHRGRQTLVSTADPAYLGSNETDTDVPAVRPRTRRFSSICTSRRIRSRMCDFLWCIPNLGTLAPPTAHRLATSVASRNISQFFLTQEEPIQLNSTQRRRIAARQIRQSILEV